MPQLWQSMAVFLHVYVNEKRLLHKKYGITAIECMSKEKCVSLGCIEGYSCNDKRDTVEQIFDD